MTREVRALRVFPRPTLKLQKNPPRAAVPAWSPMPPKVCRGGSEMREDDQGQCGVLPSLPGQQGSVRVNAWFHLIRTYTVARR